METERTREREIKTEITGVGSMLTRGRCLVLIRPRGSVFGGCGPRVGPGPAGSSLVSARIRPLPPVHH